MDAESYQRACQLFDAALEQPSALRSAFLSGACAHDVTLRHQVERMIAQDRDATGLLDRPMICPTWNRTPRLPKMLTHGTRIGPYRVTGTLGHGGMGIVYHGIRDDDTFRRQVAIKVVRELPSGHASSRFRHERQILAGLEHPFIARLYDGGETQDHHPFLVMEYVDGLPITTHCDRHRLTIVERLALMRKVCAAVQFAHRNLIIHCDLKPSNILVNRDGDPKLLDFGIAKLLEPGSTTESGEAVNDQRLLTPSHASPEQALGQPATTATDIYSLGLVLSEVLCGAVPFVADDISNYELLRRVCEAPPTLPSRVVRTAAPTASRAPRPADTAAMPPAVVELAHNRRTTPWQLYRRLEGDLDRIVDVALAKEPEERYASAAQLDDDLGRHLEHLPLLAGPKTAFYRLAKLGRRHRAAVTVGASFMVLLAVLVSLFIFTLFEQIEHTSREQKTTQRLLGFLIETFSLSNPDATLGETVTARELLDQGARRIAVELEGEPEVRAMMLQAMGQIYFQIGLLSPAETLLSQGLEQRLELVGNHDAAITESLTLLGDAQRAAGKLQQSEAHLRRAVDRGRTLDDRHVASFAASLEALATLRRLQYEFSEAETLYREAVTLRRRAGAVHRPQLARSLAALGILLREQGDFALARELFSEALAIRQGLFADTHPDVADSLRHLASLEHSVGNPSDAEQLYRQALRINLELYGEGHLVVVDLKNSLALTLGDQGKLTEATRLLTESVEGLRSLAGTNHPDFATMASNLAMMLTRQGVYDPAEKLFREVLETRIQLFGERHPYVGQTYLTWGNLERQRGQLAAAESHYRLAAEIATTLPAGHRAIAYPNLALARLWVDHGQPEDAAGLLAEVLAELRVSHSPNHWRIAVAEATLGRALTVQGQFEAAESCLVTARELLAANPDNVPSRQRETLEWLLDLYRRWQRPDLGQEIEQRLAEL